jgi:hypothetical protein
VHLLITVKTDKAALYSKAAEAIGAALPGTPGEDTPPESVPAKESIHEHVS